MVPESHQFGEGERPELPSFSFFDIHFRDLKWIGHFVSSPLTAQTDGILNIELFRKCTKGTYLINVARGKHLVEEDLITALEEGHLSGALLDVFQQEPLPKNHPFWEQEKISITPHIASITNPEAAAPQIIENYRNLENGLAFINQIDRKKGY